MSRRDFRSVTLTISRHVSRTKRSSSCRTRVTDKTYETSSSFGSDFNREIQRFATNEETFLYPQTHRFLLINDLIFECYAFDYRVHFVISSFRKYHDPVLCTSPFSFYSDKSVLEKFVKITGYFLSILAILKSISKSVNICTIFRMPLTVRIF